jgi:UDP-N-acetylglucosamine--N-acetylmuramyl-(pentapeptide) pyrophosphoryl-undecaprenol N-acetylglucosamine transferase
MAKQKEIKIALIAGGTAGHIMPLLAVHSATAELSKERGLPISFVFLGNPGKYEDKFIELNIPVKKIVESKLRRYFSFNNLLEFPKFVFGFCQSIWHILMERPDILMSKGGPGSLAPIIAAHLLKIPVAIHESDATPSITTKLSAKFSRIIFLAFEEARVGFRSEDKQKCEVVGNPLRPFILKDIPKKRDAKISLGFAGEKPLMVIIGGSQGSRRINKLVLESLPKILEEGVQILHQTGPNLLKEVAAELKEVPEGYRYTDFFDKDIKEVFAAADLVISRAGSSIFEFAFFGIPSILIPLPESAQNHQVLNGFAYERAGACLVLEEKEMSSISLVKNIQKILSDPSFLLKMSESAKVFAKPAAARKIAEKLIELANG